MRKTLLLTMILSGLLFACHDNKKKANETKTVITQKVEKASENNNYDNLKAEHELIGKWKISNTTANLTYPFEIYRRGNEYIGVFPQDNFKTEILEKSGNKYSVKGNKYGEYYIISSSKEMTLFDKDGELESMGYKATKE